jgi:hypothetical protein
MSFQVTGNNILDFALIQSMSIHYLSESAIHLVKWQNSENQHIRKLSEPPVAAWYSKAVGTGLRVPNEVAKPCIKTTAFSIRSLSQLAHILPNYRVLSYLDLDSLLRDWKAIAALQLEFCLEYQKENSCTPGEQSAIIEGGSYFLHVDWANEESPDFMPDLQELSHQLTEELDMTMVSTMELASVLRGISIWFKHNNNKQRSDFLTSLALEILNRKSRSGLFYSSPEGFSSAPSGQQFFILGALLESFKFIQLDHVIEEVFNIFSNLYRIAYKEAIELFSFKRRRISYTAFEIGALISCLNSLSGYSTNLSGQRDIINNIVDSFLDLIIQSYNHLHEKEINKLVRWIYLAHEGKAKRKDKPHIRTVFPKRIYLSYPYQDIDWNRKGIVSQFGIFYLCSSLLSLIDREDTDFQYNIGMSMDIPAMEAIKALLDIFITP